ncbi:MAG: hypothetical protein ACE361_07350 [Aureliella sp.]
MNGGFAGESAAQRRTVDFQASTAERGFDSPQNSYVVSLDSYFLQTTAQQKLCF